MTTEKNHSPQKKPGVFYGYWIVAATFIFLFVTSGCGFFAFSLFVKPLEADMGWGRGGIMTAWTIYFLVAGVAAPFVGRLINRFEARRVIAAGALVVGLGFISLSQINSPWHFYLSYAAIGTGMVAMGHIPSTTIVSNWFKKWRGTTIGIMSTGIGAGGFVLAPLIGGYLIPTFGWRTSYLIMGVFVWVMVIPVALLVIKLKPADMGLYPDGKEAPEALPVTETSSLGTKAITPRMALATSAFWLIALSFLTGNFSQVSILQTQAPHLVDIGFPVALAAGALGGVGLGSTMGKFIFGWLCDRIPPKYAWSIGLGLQVVGITILMNIKPESPVAMVWVYAIVMGLSAGAWLPTMSMIVSTTFGLAAYGTIFGIVTLFQSIGVATGPLMMGSMYDLMGNYQLAFIIALVLHVVALPAALAIRRPKSFQSL